MVKTALFRFDASPNLGAGHAIRSSVIADALMAKGWQCKIITSANTYEFIPNLARFERLEPDEFYARPIKCDLLVVDNYDLDEKYEQHFRHVAKKILVIDDLANRKHHCDILLDQTYGRDANDYKKLVPSHCKILAGSDYVLLRKEFIQLRPKALAKRRNTKEIKRILVSMGGSDPKNYTLKALAMIKKAGFKGAIDIVLGFSSQNLTTVKKYIRELPNECTIHTNADMAKLTYNADVAIGAAGGSVWERCCLGLPQILMVTADNQKKIYENLIKSKIVFPILFLNQCIKSKPQSKTLFTIIDGGGTKRILNELVAK